MAAIEDRTFKRQDGKDKVTGLGRYTADLELTGLVHCKFRYAGIAHGRIRSIDTAKAEALPGVFAVVTHADVPDVAHGGYIQDRRLFAKDYTRFEGEIIAAVAAATPEIAEAACDLIEVDLEPLPVVNDIEESLAEGAPLVHADWQSYGDAFDIVRAGNEACHSSIVHGDVEAGFAEADEVVRERYVADMQHAAPIEPRAVIAEWHGDQVTIWSSTQVPFNARSGVAHCLGMPENAVRVIVPHLGGGFGGKCEFHFEAHVAAVARKAKRPAKLVFSRREEFIAPDHRREGMVVELETGVKRDGTITARRARILIDNGAYTADAGFFRSSPACTRSARTGSRPSTCRPTSPTPTTSRPARCAPPPPRRRTGRSSAIWTSWRARSAWTRSPSASTTSCATATRRRRARCSTRTAPRSASSPRPR